MILFTPSDLMGGKNMYCKNGMAVISNKGLFLHLDLELQGCSMMSQFSGIQISTRGGVIILST
jgi:hypothetical protein